MSVSLVKGQKVNLAKEGSKLTRISMGLGWDAIKRGGGLFKGLFGGGSDEIDLDASCLAFDANHELLDAIFYNNLKGFGGAIAHAGDNRTGAGDGDDEVIDVDLSLLPATVKSMVFIVSSYEGHTFDRIANAYCRVTDKVTGKELVKFDISDSGNHTGLVMAKIYLHNGEWKMHAIGEKAHGRTPVDLLPAASASL